MNRITLLAAVSALSLFGAAAQASTIDTTPFWDGASSISAFGGNATGVYGETFVAPGGDLTDYTFYVNTGAPLDVVGQVYAWDGSLTGGSSPQGAVGPALFTSAQFTIDAGRGFQAVTVNTGSLALTAGQHYVALLADVNPNDFGSASWGDILFSHPGVAGDGGFNFYNNDHTTGSINANAWDSFNDFGSLAWTANFTGGGAPEPAEWALMVLGFGGAGAMLRRRAALAA